MTKKSNTLPVGYRLQQYRIEAVLGAGGFGITYMAVHEALQTRAAVKEYFPVEWSYRDRNDINVLANTQGTLPTSEVGEEASQVGVSHVRGKSAVALRRHRRSRFSLIKSIAVAGGGFPRSP